jgi:hypothetical protein
MNRIRGKGVAMRKRMGDDRPCFTGGGPGVALAAAVVSALLLTTGGARAVQKDCSRTSRGLIPLVDLESGSYLGREGGLYPGGTNVRPSEHTQAGLDLADLVIPRDAEGGPDFVNGRIVFMSIGMSNAQMEFDRFITDAAAMPDLDPALVLFNGAEGGMSIERMTDPRAPYWTGLQDRLAAAGLDPDQVQVVWIKQAYDEPPVPDFPDHARSMAIDLARIVRNVHRHFPNVRLAYVSSRIYGGYSVTPFRDEPISYETGFGVKWLIRAQIQGHPALGFDPSAGPVAVPWLSWGPYLWADGLVPRGDGLIWECDDMQADGHHPSASGQAKVSALLVDFFRTDPTASPWFLAPGPVGPGEPPDL